MKIQKTIIFALLIGISFTACAPAVEGKKTPAVDVSATTAVNQTGVPVQTGQTAVDESIEALASALNISASQVKIGQLEVVEWQNSCLGVQKPDEMCAEMATPGYRVILEAGGKTYEYHSNHDGSQVRAVDTGLPYAVSTASLSPAADAARRAMAQQLGVVLEKVRVVSSEPVQWPNGCLGIEVAGRMCTQVITPGYRVILEVDSKQYEFHTNEPGTTVLPVLVPQPKKPEPVIVWEQTVDHSCSRAEISLQRVTYGPCGGTLKDAALASGRLEELKTLLGAYKTATQDTVAGTLEVNGMGQREPTTVEMRSIAEWARLVGMEAQEGQSDASWGLAFTWHREGGIAGFCDDLTVYRSGWGTPASCKGGQVRKMGQYRLSAGEMEKMYRWIDQLASFDYVQKDAATADAMLVKVSFVGTGAQPATTAQQEEVAGFAGRLYANAVNK